MKLKKRNKKSKLIIISLIVSLLFITIGYSYIKTTLSAGGNVKFSEEITYPIILGRKMEAHIDNTKSTYVSTSTGINFGVAPSNTNGKGLYLFSSTKNDTYPIYYFRGGDAVDGIEPTLKNNVLFGGFCWKIVRTTEKGGVKLVYNGVPNNSNTNGKCANTGDNSQIINSAFNSTNGSLADVGYMYGTRYSYTSWNDTAYVYGSDVSYNTTTKVYTLTGTSASNTIANIKTKHYTCKLTTNGTCGTVYYVYSYYENKIYAIALTNGNKLENIINDSFNNTNSSTIKTVLDNWFKSNLNGYINKLEDSVWCNDRNIAGGGYLKDSDLTTTYRGDSFFANNVLRKLETSLPEPALKNTQACSRKDDRFTVNDTTNGNGKLTYPIGLLTFDEVTVVGNGWSGSSKSAYLTTGVEYWLMTPRLAAEYGYHSTELRVIDVGRVNGPGVTTNIGVRPSIVLKKDIVASSGTGTLKDPYVVQ